MKPVLDTSGVMPPRGKQKRLYRCGRCGTVFMKAPLMPLVPVRCPRCGSFKTGEDRGVCY
jgi:DNA-directed RNA polymerase subunit RPC12/RpoP